MTPEMETRKIDETPDAGTAIKSVRVFSSGWADQHEEHRFGTSLPQLWWVLMSRSWVRTPINYFLIEHRDGLVLFDTGLDPAIKTDPHYVSSALGRFLLRRIFRLHIDADDRLDRVLAANNYSAGDIGTAVISHLHFDHVGGIARIPQAQLIVSAREWAQLSEPHPEREWILREHIEIPDAKWCPIDFQPADDPLLEPFGGTYDVAGDGSMVLLPTPGHTPGSLSMLVRAQCWSPVLLVGDLAYEASLLMNDTLPGTGNPKQLRATYSKVRQLKQKLPDLVIVPSHDADAERALWLAQPGQSRD
ncbi:MAG: N-acyl homoserine lactonase family protein [Hyphomicrobiales bacterium]|nr:N-acyl homoserine lactonase family protein [Hyphomicrobiales bacterium]